MREEDSDCSQKKEVTPKIGPKPVKALLSFKETVKQMSKDEKKKVVICP